MALLFLCESSIKSNGQSHRNQENVQNCLAAVGLLSYYYSRLPDITHTSAYKYHHDINLDFRFRSTPFSPLLSGLNSQNMCDSTRPSYTHTWRLEYPPSISTCARFYYLHSSSSRSYQTFSTSSSSPSRSREANVRNRIHLGGPHIGFWEGHEKGGTMVVRVAVASPCLAANSLLLVQGCT